MAPKKLDNNVARRATKRKRAGIPARFAASTAEMAGGCWSRLLSGSGGRAGRLCIRFGNADIAADLILANLVHYDLFRNVCARDVEEDGLVKSAVLLLEALVLDGHGEIDLVLLLVYALKLDGDIADLLGLVLASDGEFDVVALAQAAELVDFIMVASDESAHLALGHFQVFLGGVQISAHRGDLGVDVLHVILARLRRQFRVHGRVKSAELLSRLVVLLRSRFGRQARLLELTLSN